VRLVIGVLLIIGSVLTGAAVVAAADHRQAYWSLTRDLAPGTVLSAVDLRVVRVQLGTAHSAYVRSSEAVVGRALSAAARGGALLSRTDLTDPPRGVSVTVPLPPDNGPKVAPGDRITLYLSTKTCRGVVLLSGATVQAVRQSGQSSFAADNGSVVQLTVPAADARRLVASLDLPGAVVRVGVLSSGQQADSTGDGLSGCAEPAG